MSTLLATIIADFTTQLASEIAIAGTSATLSSATDDDGVALPTGRYFFTIDGANSSKEHISCTLTGTALTNIKTVSRQGVETAGVARKHRIGATIAITDFAHILQINALLAGTTDLNYLVPLKYDGTATISDLKHLATKAYVDGIAIGGSPDATTSTKGITTMSVAPASAATPIAVGDNDGRVPTQGENDALVGNNTDIAVGSGNKVVTQTGLQHGAEKYAVISSGSSTAYVAALSPVPTSLTAGMEFLVKIDVANTTTTPTLNLNSIGAKTIVKGVSTALVAGDLAANQIAHLKYDGTNLVLLNPTTVDTGFLASGIPGTTVANTTTTVLTYAVPAGTLGTNKGIRLRFRVPIANSGANASAGITVKYGGTTICSLGGYSVQSGTPTFTSENILDVLLFGGAATNVQHSMNTLIEKGSTTPATGAAASQGTSAIDSTTSQNLTIELTTSSAGATATFSDYFIQKIV